MIKDYSKLSCMVVDNGLFVELAVKMSKVFGKVYYTSPWKGAFPKSNSMLIGTGIPNVERVNDFFDYIDKVDLFIFPDVYDGDLQVHLRKLGKRVWGSGKGDELELYRKQSKEYLAKLGLNIGKYEVIIGMAKLREFLKKNDNQYVKVSTTRGDMETFEAPNYQLVEPKLDELEYTLGAKKYIMEFVVEAAIPDAVEIGYDGYTVDGQFPISSMVGIEVKDKSYIGFFKSVTEIPVQLRNINIRMADTLKKYQYRNFFCIEGRITKDSKCWLIDPCCRFGSPPGELAQEMYTNLADIFWFGADGTMIQPVPAGKYGVEVMIHSTWADKNWQAVQFPEKMRDSIKFRNLAIINGEYYVVPQGVGLPEIGAIVAIGNTLEEATRKCTELCKQVKGYYIEVFSESLEPAQEEIAKLKKMGINL